MGALLVSKRWIQVVVLLFVFGFGVLGFLALRTYTDQAPIPAEVVDPAGDLLFTGNDVREGQQIFLRNGLMEYGSFLGHGGYLGPDFTADCLRRWSTAVLNFNGGADSGEARARTVADFKANRHNPATGALSLSEAQAGALPGLLEYYARFFGEPTTRFGLRPGAIADREEVRKLTAFFTWGAWMCAATRPDTNYSYTNNWPPEPLVGNAATANSIVWSVLSLIALLGGIGALFAVFGRWDYLGWQRHERQTLSFRAPDMVGLTAGQRSCAWFFAVMALLFLLQSLLGGASQHYRAELTGFFGFDLAQWLPFNIARTWHLQLAIFWVATSFLASGIFLAPIIAGHEPKGQHWLAYALLGALTLVVFGSMAGEFLGIHGWIRHSWAWLGAQGFEYLDLGRFWQILLVVGLFFWVAILFRGLRKLLAIEHKGNMPWLFFFSALSIPAFYAVGLLARPASHFTSTDFWRFWVVHLWVEDFLELFTTIMVAYLFVLLGVVRERVALMVIYLDIILYSAGGVIGTMHHLYFSGEPAVHMALGAVFSAAEVIPLTFLTVEAWHFIQLGMHKQGPQAAPFPHFWSVMFLAAVGFWNFLGAGIFGFLINLPIISYYEIGTALTANHGHASMMGVYGMLSVGMALFCLRYIIPEAFWSDRLAKISFWSLNLGLAWMVFVTLFPLGILQLYTSINEGYFEARSLKNLTSSSSWFIEWMRLPGDALFIVGGILPLFYLCWLGVRHVRAPRGNQQEHRPHLFTETQLP